MEKQAKFGEERDLKIREILTAEFELPERAARGKQEAFAQIRAMEEKKLQHDKKLQQDKNLHNVEKNRQSKTFASAGNPEEKITAFSGKTGSARRAGKTGAVLKFAGACAAVMAVSSTLCVVNPALAAQVPIVGHVFEEIGRSLGFGEDSGVQVTPLEEAPSADVVEILDEGDHSTAAAVDSKYTQTHDGMTVTLSEVYSNSEVLYLSVVLKSEESFPETAVDESSKRPIVELNNARLRFDYLDDEIVLDDKMEGELLDDHTFAGILRIGLKDATMAVGADGKVKEIPDVVPENYKVRLSFQQVCGLKEEDITPPMPEDLKEEYEVKMAAHGLSTKEEDYDSFTEEQKELEHQFTMEQYREYEKRYPDIKKNPDPYRYWCKEGTWNFDLDVTVDDTQTMVLKINDVDEKGLGITKVTKTPFEIKVETGKNTDYFPVVLDAKGEWMQNAFSSADIAAVSTMGYDISDVHIVICDYMEFMDELKGYYWRKDYQEIAKEKNFYQYLLEHALYEKTMHFD